MAVLTSKGQYSVGMGSNQPPVVSQYAVNYRKPVGSGDSHSTGNNFLSPTESEFSANDGGEESIKNWDERKVADWLKSIGCSQYEQLFRGMYTSQLTGSYCLE